MSRQTQAGKTSSLAACLRRDAGSRERAVARSKYESGAEQLQMHQHCTYAKVQHTMAATVGCRPLGCHQIRRIRQLEGQARIRKR